MLTAACTEGDAQGGRGGLSESACLVMLMWGDGRLQ